MWLLLAADAVPGVAGRRGPAFLLHFVRPGWPSGWPPTARCGRRSCAGGSAAGGSVVPEDFPSALDALRAVVAEGDGVVARFPGVLLVAAGPDVELRRLLELCRGAAGPSPGRGLARRLAVARRRRRPAGRAAVRHPGGDGPRAGGVPAWRRRPAGARPRHGDRQHRRDDLDRPADRRAGRADGADAAGGNGARRPARRRARPARGRGAGCGGGRGRGDGGTGAARACGRADPGHGPGPGGRVDHG